MEGETKRKEEVGTLKAYGKQVMYMMRDDKTKVKSLLLPETKKVAMLLASVLTMSKSVLFGKKQLDVGADRGSCAGAGAALGEFFSAGPAVDT
jgi:hypothetical protein